MKITNEVKKPCLKKVFVYGEDGTGKSTFVEEYCKKHGLRPIIFDFDDTNYVSSNIVDFELEKKGIRNYLKIMKIVKEVKELKEKNKDSYDTIVFDGVSSFVDSLVGDGRGLLKYSQGEEYFKNILYSLRGLNFIFIGQIDTDISKYNESEQKPSKLIVRLHNICNEKYHCQIGSDNEFEQVVKKFREHPEFLGKKYAEIGNRR